MVTAGAGFWLTDASIARAEAEAVAKTTYAATRDPSDVALLYMGLGRKPLLQVDSPRWVHPHFALILCLDLSVTFAWPRSLTQQFLSETQ